MEETITDLLARPEPQELTDQEIDQLAWNWYSKEGSTWWQREAWLGLARAVIAADRARAALAQPEPEGATEEALASFTAYFCRNYPGPDTIIHKPEWHAPKIFHAAADALARYARPTIEPVPVGERPILKSSNFNDANGHCWCGTRASVDETGDLSVEMPPSWELREPCAQDDCVLPHHALPIPATY